MPVEITFNALPDLEQAIRAELGLVISKTAHDINAGAKRKMAEPKSGRTYKRRGRVHRAAAEGEAAAIETGNLANSGYVDTSEVALHLRAETGFTAAYTPAQELGTPDSPAHPFLTPAAEENRDAFNKASAAAVQRAARKVGKAG